MDTVLHIALKAWIVVKVSGLLLWECVRYPRHWSRLTVEDDGEVTIERGR